ncbi:MAG: DUF5985 family protein [Acidobacteriota bacterium]
MPLFLDGVVAMGCAAAALVFLRFWRESDDRVAFAFALALGIFAIDYTLLGLVPIADERRAYVFVPRLLGFAAILWGIVEKHRTMGRRR